MLTYFSYDEVILGNSAVGGRPKRGGITSQTGGKVA